MSTKKRYTAFLAVLLAIFVSSISVNTAAAQGTQNKKKTGVVPTVVDCGPDCGGGGGGTPTPTPTPTPTVTPTPTPTPTVTPTPTPVMLLIVDTVADDASLTACTAAPNDCSLRGAITDANANAGADTIEFDAGIFATPQTITLTSGELAISDDLTILGTGARNLTISGNNISRVFFIGQGTTVTFDSMTFSGGNGIGGSSSGSGGAIFNEGGNLTITNSTVSGSSAPFGGGIGNFGTLNVTNSTIWGNESGFEGGGIGNSGTLNVTNSTISGNKSGFEGGGIGNFGILLNVTNSTISGNRSLLNESGAGGGIFSVNTVNHMTNTIVAGNLAGAVPVANDIAALIDNADHNLIGDAGSAGGIVNGVNGNIVGVDPKLGPLQFNGGPTMTQALLPGSPAIDAGVASGQTTDQRGAGFARTYDNPDKANASDGDGTDIGAFEVQQPCSLCSFAPAVNFGVGVFPASVTTGDFNGDGKLDLATANFDSDNVSVLIGDGAGGFAPAVNFGAGSGPRSVTTGDFNGDGKLDMATANFGDSNVSVLLNNCTSNTAPEAVSDSYSTNEDTPLSVSAFGVLTNDTDAENDTLTAVLVAGPSNEQSFALNADGSFTYTPKSNFNGTDSFTYKANDGTLDSNVTTVTITVTPVNDAPVATASPKTQSSVQYSDPISTVTINASDVETPASGLTIAFSYKKDGGATVIGLPAGMIQGGTAGAWTVSGVAGVSKGTYVIAATVTDTGDGSAAAVSSSDTFTIVVTLENAVAAPQLSNPVSMQVASAGGTASGTTSHICFDITEPADGNPGDTSLIDTATVQINAVGGGGSGTITPSAVTFSGGGVGQTRTGCFTLTMTNATANVYELVLVIGGDYYTGSGTTAFTVFDPSAGFASGGGWIINPINGYRANFGVNIKYLKNGNSQGSILYVEHRPDGDYKVKSTSLNSKGGFAIIPITGGSEADIAGKANFGINDEFTGNFSFIARVIDKGTSGTSDQFGLKLINPSGQIVADLTFNPVILGGGNNQVPKK